MLVLTTAQKLEIVLGGTVTTNQLQFVASYIDTTDDVTGVQHGTTNNTTDVELVAAPSADLRLVRSIHIYNADTASATVTVKYDQSATERILRKASIAAGSTLVYDSQAGWYVDSPYGAQGPTGLTGATGATGATGPQGPSVTQSESITIETPTNAEDASVFFTAVAITITKMAAVLTGSSTPSVTWTVRHSTDRNATGNEVVTSGTTTTSTTTGSIVTSFNDATIPANSFVWLETTAKSGTVTSINVTLIFTTDA